MRVELRGTDVARSGRNTTLIISDDAKSDKSVQIYVETKDGKIGVSIPKVDLIRAVKGL